MRHKINRPALDRFIADELDALEAMPVPAEIAELTRADEATEGLTWDEFRAVWLGAGLATHVGLVLVEEPERFIATTPVEATA